jgi:predicted membrane protein
MKNINREIEENRSDGQIAILPLLIGIFLTLLLTIYPLILTKITGKADHNAAYFALWSMSAGFIRGVGFIPKNKILRLLFSTSTCIITLIIAILIISVQWI